MFPPRLKILSLLSVSFLTANFPHQAIADNNSFFPLIPRAYTKVTLVQIFLVKEM